MTVSIDFSQPLDLTLAPEDSTEETIQSLYILLNTAIGEVPCYRDFGVDSEYLHKPMNVAQTMYAASITAAIQKYMPDILIENISFTSDPNNPATLYPKLEVTIEDE